MPLLSRRKRLQQRAPPGTSPGTLIADPKALAPRLCVIAYDVEGIVEEELTDLEQLPALLSRYSVVWLDVAGLGDVDMIACIGELFGLHRLALEDVLSVSQRPKVEDYGDVRFVMARMVEWKDTLETEQLGLFLGPKFVITFQERPGDGFDPVRARIRGGKGLLRKSGPDYLAYALLDATVDGYFPALEKLGERLEALEEDLLVDPRPESLHHVHELKRDLLVLRRTVWPMRDALHLLLRADDTRITPQTRLYLNDCYDHTVQVMDFVETYREIASGLVELHLSSLSNRLNEAMKVLTIIATIFIPLTFVAGVYGMNFSPDASPWNMPELRWRYGYPACLLAMAIIAIGMLLFFRRRGWIGKGNAGAVKRALLRGWGGADARATPADLASTAHRPTRVDPSDGTSPSKAEKRP